MKNFKDSGIEWLGEIPEHWEIVPIRYCFNEFNVRCNDNNYPLLSVTIANGVVYQNDITNKKDTSNDDKSSYKIVPIGAIAYNKMRMWQGAVGINMLEKGIVSPAYVVAIPNKQINISFSYYLLKSKNMISEYEKYSYGLCSDMNNLRYEDFQNIKIPLPPLKEQKQAFINETITKGLDKNINFKDSGIEHLGEIPKHWKIVKLKYLGSFQNGISINSEAFGAGYPFVSYGDIYNNICIPYNIKGLVNSTEIDRKIYSVKQGDIFFTRTSETIDEIGISSVCLKTIENAVFAGFLIRFRADKKVLDNNFAKFYFRRSFNQSFFAKENGLVTRASLSQELLGRLSVVIPPLKEQEQIAKFLDSEISKIDAIIEKTKKQIKLIKEYKTTLINQAVCGRISL
ncbi:restriction endonuclease subunit S [Campylobacter jejuni]|uniref:restriction endonuclease subunit S n=1 Tax=Campylobacter jejuni TaxID=197 RepID=UPI000F7FF67D|nr:restriction endonuclease subunit S [Campylobacter jejuni]RTK03442.1 restriction endonuclease subunit S [Campylobacter jejuni]